MSDLSARVGELTSRRNFTNGDSTMNEKSARQLSLDGDTKFD